jgi:hypothetical protein
MEYTKSNVGFRLGAGQNPGCGTGPRLMVWQSSAACGARKLPWYHPEPRRIVRMSPSIHSHLFLSTLYRLWYAMLGCVCHICSLLRLCMPYAVHRGCYIRK